MTGIEAAVEYLRERETDLLDDVRLLYANRHGLMRGAPVAIPKAITELRRIRQMIASLRDVERRARIEGIREGMSMAQERASAFCMSSCGADIDWDRAESAMDKRIAELESE